jgi:hypothetical protein
VLAAFAVAGLALVTFAIAATTPPKSGPFCRSGCLSYPFDDAASRVPRDFVWMYPAVLLSLAFVLFLIAVHRSSPAATSSFTLLALALGCIAAAVLAVDYFVQLAVVQPSLLAGETEGLALLSQYNPHGMFVALEEFGYLLLSASLLCLAPALRTGGRRGRLAAWVSAAGFALSVLALVVVSVVFGLQREYRFEVYVIAIDYTVLLVVSVLVGSVFHRAV